ncbi:MAG: hypothetical protein Q9160_006646 [Pyrenula sp. 1 TL-2023]
MEFDDPLDLAQVAISRVADIASLLGVRYKRPLCGRLGAELFLVAEYLDTAGLDREEELRLRVSKLLRDVESICRWPNHASGSLYPILETLSKAKERPHEQSKIHEEIECGLLNITSNTGVAAESAIHHIQRIYKKSRRRARFEVKTSQTSDPPVTRQFPEISHGHFCKLITLEADSRICLTIQNQKLHRIGFEPMTQFVQHSPGLSLADVLKRYRLTAKMKLALAYIVAHSVWQYYDSDWMKSQWTSETIHFIAERGSRSDGGNGLLFTCKPYVAIRFGDKESELPEHSRADGEIHRFPRIRSLGVMLVEIGIGRQLHGDVRDSSTKPTIAAINDDLLSATACLQDDSLWENCDYPNYLSAANQCLDPGNFPSSSYVQGSGDESETDDLKQRRNILYDKVVFPLQELLQGTRWLEQLTNIGPLPAPVKRTSIPALPALTHVKDVPVESKDTQKNTKPVLKKSEKDARRWLSRMQRLSHELADRAPQIDGIGSQVRIAVLDTGCDENAPFFLNPGNGSRLKDWKDWVDGSHQLQDCHGHGTHLISLIMKIAPEAHIYVARIANRPEDLVHSSSKVAQAISWASSEWKADIVSMSFGYADEQPAITGAIYESLYRRHGSVLFFAAASNYGTNEKEMHPARHESVISIRGTNSNGDFEDFNPPRSYNEGIVIGTLGVDVPSAWISDYDDEVFRSGTSVATAVAVGIAGVLLQYVRSISSAGAFHNANKKLGTHKGMQAMLKTLAYQTLKEHYLYLAPWRQLSGKSDEERRVILMAALSDVS